MDEARVANGAGTELPEQQPTGHHRMVEERLTSYRLVTNNEARHQTRRVQLGASY